MQEADTQPQEDSVRTKELAITSIIRNDSTWRSASRDGTEEMPSPSTRLKLFIPKKNSPPVSTKNAEPWHKTRERETVASNPLKVTATTNSKQREGPKSKQVKDKHSTNKSQHNPIVWSLEYRYEMIIHRPFWNTNHIQY